MEAASLGKNDRLQRSLTTPYESGRSGDFFAIGFNIRAKDISLHILPGHSNFPDIAARLGPHRRGKRCWYIPSIDCVDEAAVKDFIRTGLKDLAAKWAVRPT